MFSIFLLTCSIAFSQDGSVEVARLEQSVSTARPHTARSLNTRYADYQGIQHDAMEALAAGDVQGGIMLLDQLIAEQPRNATALLARADAYEMAGEPHRAVTDRWSVLGSYPTGPFAERALHDLGTRALLDGELRSAEILLERAVKIAPHNAQAWCDRGMLKAAYHKNEEALEDLETAVQLDPLLDKAHVNKGLILLRMGFRQEGCASLLQAHDLGDLSTEEMLLIHCDR